MLKQLHSITDTISIENLVPEIYADWRPLVKDSLVFVFTRLSKARLAAKIAEQKQLPPDTPTAIRLLQLISRMPGIQKLGQVLARNPNLDPSLRFALSQLENGLSDVEPAVIHRIISKQLGTRLAKYQVEVDAAPFSEASVSAVVRFTWCNPRTSQRERGVFKVMKPHVPRFFKEDMALLQKLSDHLTKDAGYGIGSREIGNTVEEVRVLLEHELDFRREQAALLAAYRTHRFTAGLRVPAPILVLCTSVITAMSEEQGVKVTDAFRNDPIRRRRIAEQLVEALLTVPLLSREKYALFHADPHAGNILYDEESRELVLLDWALTERLSLESRRHLTLLVIMAMLRDTMGVAREIRALSLNVGADPARERMIEERVCHFFAQLEDSPSALDAMRLLDRLALDGVRFPASLAMFRKVLFTLDGVLHDVTGTETRMDYGIVREYFLRLVSSFGLYHSPLKVADVFALEQSALMYPARVWIARHLPSRQQSSAAAA